MKDSNESAVASKESKDKDPLLVARHLSLNEVTRYYRLVTGFKEVFTWIVPSFMV